MPNFGSYKPEQRFLGMFVGPSGCGKTCAEASFQDEKFPGIVDVMDFDMRIGGLQGATWLTDKQKNNIQYTSFPPRMENLVSVIDSKLEAILLASKIGQPVPQTLILDSLTSECFAVMTYASKLTHTQGSKGKYVGNIAMAGPEDYGVEATVTYSIVSFFRSIPIRNIIVSAHVIPTYGKEDPENPYSNSIPVGEKLSVRDKIGANTIIYFDHVFRFDKREVGGKERFYVKFRGSQPYRTAYPWLPSGEHEWTGRNFYEFMYSFRPKEEVAK